MKNVPIELSRTVRFAINPGGPDEAARHNTFAGWPSIIGLGAHYELDVVCRGNPDPLTGYVMNISTIDKAVRSCALPIIQSALCAEAPAEPARLLADLLASLQPQLNNAVASIRWHLTPYHSLAMTAASTDRVLITQQFEFAASHRLHVASLSAEENRRVFGKCNSPHGHGHNYKVEPHVSLPLVASHGAQGKTFTLQTLERIVDETIIQRFDHKHLNLDTTEFATLNPSVENIAKVCHDLLRDPIAKAGARLERLTIWETEKTRCTYPAT